MENGRKFSFNGPTNAAGVLTPLRRLISIRCSGRQCDVWPASASMRRCQELPTRRRLIGSHRLATEPSRRVVSAPGCGSSAAPTPCLSGRTSGGPCAVTRRSFRRRLLPMGAFCCYRALLGMWPRFADAAQLLNPSLLLPGRAGGRSHAMYPHGRQRDTQHGVGGLAHPAVLLRSASIRTDRMGIDTVHTRRTTDSSTRRTPTRHVACNGPQHARRTPRSEQRWRAASVRSAPARSARS
jgi:hypothetical protein